jgi:hypothetical protein
MKRKFLITDLFHFLRVFSKIIEKIIHKRLYCHLNKNNILINEQFGFREKLYIEMATFTLLNKVLSFLDRKNFVGGLSCDLQKAFDLLTMTYFWPKWSFMGSLV